MRKNPFHHWMFSYLDMNRGTAVAILHILAVQRIHLRTGFHGEYRAKSRPNLFTG